MFGAKIEKNPELSDNIGLYLAVQFLLQEENDMKIAPVYCNSFACAYIFSQKNAESDVSGAINP